MAVLWVIIFLTSIGLQLVQGLPVNPTPQTHSHEASGTIVEGWGKEASVYAAIPALALVVTAVGLLFGCTWCKRHHDCKPNEGAENQLFTASVTHLHDARRSQPPDSGFSEPVNNNVSEDNNNGPISLREMQNIANNNAAAYIVSENEERNRIRDSVVEFEPLPADIRLIDPLERCADWFAGEDFPRNQLQYLREIGRGWFGRVVEGEIEDGASNSTVAVKILNQNASSGDKARFLDDARLYRDMDHENILGFVAKCLQEDPWILIFELCSMDLQQYLIQNRPKMAILNESGVPLQLMCDVSSALAHIHSRGYLYGTLRSSNVLIRGSDNPRAVLGQYTQSESQHYHNASTDVWSLGFLIWEICTWGATPTADRLPPPPDLPCPYRDHLYQVMQLCWNTNPEARPTAAQVHALINHLHFTHTHTNEATNDDGYASNDFEERWQRLKPNSIPKIDEHVAIVHAPSTSMASHFTGSDQDFDNAQTIQDSLSVEMDTAVSRSSSIMSDKDALSIQIKSESLTNLHGSLEDVRNIYLTHNETPALECHQGNISLEEVKEKEHDRSDSSMDPWLKDIITSSTDDVSYYRDVSDVIKNLDSILNSEKTSSSESSHQASPSRDNLSLECKKEYPMQTSMVKSPGINNFQNILEMGFEIESESNELCDDDEGDRDTVGTLSHSFERHSDTISQQTLENITPETPIKDIDNANINTETDPDILSTVREKELNCTHRYSELPNDSKLDISYNEVSTLKELCLASMPSVSETMEQVILKQDCQKPYITNIKNIRTDSTETKSIDINKTFISNEIKYTENENFTIGFSEKQIKKTNIILDDATTPVSTKAEPKDYLVNTNFATDDLGDIKVLNHISLRETQNETENITEKPFENPEEVLKTDERSNMYIPSDCKIPHRDEQVLEPLLLNFLPENDCHQNFSIHLETECRELDMPEESKNDLLDINLSSPKHFNNIDNSYLDTDHSKDSTAIPALHKDLPDEFAESPCEQFKDQINLKREESTKYDNAVDFNDLLLIQQIEDPLISEMNDNLIDTNSRISTGGKIDDNFNKHSIKEVSCSKLISDTCSVFQDNIVNEDKITITKDADTSEVATVNLENDVESLPIIHIFNSQCNRKLENKDLVSIVNHVEEITEQPEAVQIQSKIESQAYKVLDVNIEHNRLANKSHPLEEVSEPEKVQNRRNSDGTDLLTENTNIEDVTVRLNELSDLKFDNCDMIKSVKEKVSDNTVYMDLTNNTNSRILKDNSIDNNYKCVIQSCLDNSNSETPYTLITSDSTVYLDLPSIIRETYDFLNSEKFMSSQCVEFKDNLCTSTPKSSDASTDDTMEGTKQGILTETKMPDHEPGVTVTKLDHKYLPENLSPFESPSKSHHTDTYEENSSVVLGPFENCNLELFKGVKAISEITDLPKEELLAFSSNFSEMNLETPSPLRDGNFLNEVPDLPDIIQDELQFDDIATISEAKLESQTANNTDETEEQSTTERRVSPLTPPNSPGNFLASTSNQKYLVDIDISPSKSSSVSTVYHSAIDLNQMELQMTKLAIAENENNLNIEYSGPLVEEGITLDESVVMRDNDAIPESYLAGNGGPVENIREDLAIDEERMKELRNELELKLPLAQVAGIEPAVPEAEWTELPPPPELVVTYGALSPIAEETRTQLRAYENDDHWSASVQTESSASYPEPCNNSTDEVTDLLTGANTGPRHSNEHSTYTIQSKEPSQDLTYTIIKDIPVKGIPSSKETSMSADSLNASPLKKLQESQSPIDKTYNKTVDDKESNCERLSQVSPFLLSPTTETSAPGTSDNVTGLSSISKTTVPTDAKSSKPSETQCLSKATSIDSWCSNDTLYNVEENFDDLAMDPDIPLDFDAENEKEKSESEDTLTHNEEKEASRCSTYIVHDSKSEVCETFSPESVTANDNYTYTKIKTDAGTTASVITKSDLNDSTKNSPTKDLAYGTLMSGMPSYSNCTTEIASAFDDAWMLPQPEMVRRSPSGNTLKFTPPRDVDIKDTTLNVSPQLTSEPRVNMMDSVEISCLENEVIDCETPENPKVDYSKDSYTSQVYFGDMGKTSTSTPISASVQDCEDINASPLLLPQEKTEGSVSISDNILNFQTFFQSAEMRPQDISFNTLNEATSSEGLLEGESNLLSKDSQREQSRKSSDFEHSVEIRPVQANSEEKSSQSLESGTSSEGFRNFRNSVQNYAQDLISLIDDSSLLLKSERICSDLTKGDVANLDFNNIEVTETESPNFTSYNYRNLFESHSVNNGQPLNFFITDLDIEEETEQPHSIIITESPLVGSNVSPNKTFDTHTKANRLSTEMNHTYDSHSSYQQANNILGKDSNGSQLVNGGTEPKCDNLEYKSSEQTNLANSSTVIAVPLFKSPKENQAILIPEPESHTEDNEKETNILSDQNVFNVNTSVTSNGGNENYATVNFINETFEELMESNVDDNDIGISDLNKEDQTASTEKSVEILTDSESTRSPTNAFDHLVGPTITMDQLYKERLDPNGIAEEEKQVTSATEDFLRNEKKHCQLDSYFPLLSDIRFTGPATEILSTSFTQDSPTDPTSPECEQDSKPDATADILKEWDSDSDSHSTNSSSGEFIWKDGDGHETAVVPSTNFEHQRDSNSQPSNLESGGAEGDMPSSGGSGDSASGSEGDEVEFVPSSWDCRAAPSKSSLRSLEQQPLDSKKRVVFKRQKYHCVYEYPREVADIDADSPAAYLPDFSTYSDWDATSAEDAELGYGQLFGAPNPLDMFPIRAGIAFGADYDEDFFISSSARPFESLGVMSTSSQFFPGAHLKPPPRELADEIDDFPPPPSPLPTPTYVPTRTPSLDFTTPDSGVEDITPGSISEDDYKTKKLPETDPTQCWRSIDSASSSESVSPSSPGGESLGGLRHTRDKLKLDLPPSPHIPSPRHNRVFNFVLDKPKRRDDKPTEVGTTPLVMTDETPIVTMSLPMAKDCDDVMPEPTFSTFGKSSASVKPTQSVEPEKNIILTDEVEDDAKEESSSKVEPVKGEGTVLDSGDEDSGIESSSKATLERNKTPNIS